jgi:uncharacterized protein YeaO (DUF488 family)
MMSEFVIRAVRVYDISDEDVGARWPVDRIWPRGFTNLPRACRLGSRRRTQ